MLSYSRSHMQLHWSETRQYPKNTGFNHGHIHKARIWAVSIQTDWSKNESTTTWIQKVIRFISLNEAVDPRAALYKHISTSSSAPADEDLHTRERRPVIKLRDSDEGPDEILCFAIMYQESEKRAHTHSQCDCQRQTAAPLSPILHTHPQQWTTGNVVWV